MFKRFLILIILLSMVLHSLSRLGVLSVVYENRFVIAVYFGFLEEKPITVCSADYFADDNLVVVEDDQTREALPVAFFTKEIILIQPQITTFNFESNSSIGTSSALHITDNLSLGYPRSVFQPPTAIQS
ncbi:MAG: hypothetical protein ACK57K_11875 [Chryseotalea sp.]